MPSPLADPYGYGGYKVRPGPGRSPIGIIPPPNPMTPGQAAYGPHEGPNRPPGPPDPRFIPQAPSMPGGTTPPGITPPKGMGPFPPGMAGPMPPPQRNGVPGDQGSTLSPPAGPGDMGPPDPNAGMPDPETVKAMMALGVFPDKMGAMDQQIAQAEALRSQPLHEMRQAGRLNVAANPLELVGNLAQSYAAKRQLEGGPERLGGLIPAVEGGGLRGQKNKMLDDTAAARARLINELLKNQRM